LKCGAQEIFAKNCAFLVVVKLPLLAGVITQRVVAILPLPEERSSQLLCGGTLKSRKFLLARRTGHEILHARTVSRLLKHITTILMQTLKTRILALFHISELKYKRH